jgi:hypothetical protein
MKQIVFVEYIKPFVTPQLFGNKTNLPTYLVSLEFSPPDMVILRLALSHLPFTMWQV